jgi:hypothetical protein
VIDIVPPKKAQPASLQKIPVSVTEVFRQVRIVRHSFDRKAAGGIENLQLTLANSSECSIEEAQVQVEYLNAKGELLRTKVIPIERLRPSSSLLIRVPDSDKGVNIKLQLLNIYMPKGFPKQKTA